MTKIPRVFLSHASEDKERFVIRFAEALRSKGVDVWLDRWEMVPGDSVVEKIFDEGIGKADGVIIVLSRNSIQKPWVREELNAAVVKRINEGIMLIPVVLDGCEVPVALQSTFHLVVQDLADIDGVADKVRGSFYRHSERPPLGPVPSYAQSSLAAFPGLSRLDSLILSMFAECALEGDDDRANTEAVWKKAEKQSISRQDFLEAVGVLEEEAYLRNPGIAAKLQPFFFVPLRVLEENLASQDNDFGEKIDAVAAAAVNMKRPSDATIAKDLVIRQRVVRVILEQLESRGLLELFRPAGTVVIVVSTSVNLRRRVQSGTAGQVW